MAPEARLPQVRNHAHGLGVFPEGIEPVDDLSTGGWLEALIDHILGDDSLDTFEVEPNTTAGLYRIRPPR